VGVERMVARVVKHGFSKFRAMLTQHTTSDLKVKKRYGHAVNHLKKFMDPKVKSKSQIKRYGSTINHLKKFIDLKINF
jgi:hypothetical protein